MADILYYVDPGSGFVFGQNIAVLWGIALGLFGTFVFFLRLFFKKLIWIFLILLILLIIGGLIMHKNKYYKKVIILGIDAMDSEITEKLIQEGRLPNLSILKTKGTYSHLTTTMPAESVVAWTSFATGLNPGMHGVFDFIMRDSNSYLPYLTLNEVATIQGKSKIKIYREGEVFWKILSKNKIPTFVYFCPNTFPPDAVIGRMLSGMGVPDILGMMGRFSFYTTKKLAEEDKDSRGRVINVEFKDNIANSQIYGPKITSGGLITDRTIPLKIILDPHLEKITLEFQDRCIVLKEKKWSDWQKVSFKIGLFKNAYGILRFYLKSIKPEFELYMSPINFDPQGPLFPISYPKDYAKRVTKKVGLYYTQGMPHDTWSLTEGRLDEGAFLEIVDEILREREGILNEELKEFKGGVFFFYFDTLDVIQHMFWRYLDPQHPLYIEDSLYKDTIFKYYEKIDQIIGKVLKNVDNNTTLIVLSDHGFSSFRKTVHINRWLLENGFLYLNSDIKESKGFFEGIDWSRTKAYALGFGGIYLNRLGRELYGVVEEYQIQDLKEAIASALKQLRDPQTGEKVVNNVYYQEDIFDGPCIDNAPDLFVGFNKGFRASWQTALGGVPTSIMEDNKKKWSGDHLVDSILVPGVIFVNRQLELKEPSIIDIVPTVLSLFSISRSKEMPGKSLFQEK